MIDLDVEIRWTKSATPDLRRLLGASMAVAGPTAAHIRRRMTRGRLAAPGEPFQGPRQMVLDRRFKRATERKRKYYISPAYAQACGVGEDTRWQSSAEFHAAVGSVPGYVTGGMWAGLQVKNYGREAALIHFRGSSLGSSSERRELKVRTDEYTLVRSAKTGKVRKKYVFRDRVEGEAARYSRRAKKVRNDEKAGRLFKHMKIHALQPTQGERDAAASAIGAELQLAVVQAFDADLVQLADKAGDAVLFQAIRKEFSRR